MERPRERRDKILRVSLFIVFAAYLIGLSWWATYELGAS